MLKPGQLIAGRYLLESEIGEGAMGAVFRALDQTLKRQVAIKFLFVKGMRDPQAMVDQFLREARIAASVQHRNVIHTVDFGTVDGAQPFMVMELLNGESLGERMAREPPLSRDQFIHLVSLTLRGLAAVHDAGIVHRDLKPQNIFLQRDADAVYPKILDFGISRSLEHAGERPSAIATQEGLIVGTPDYMSPEQARGEAGIDRRSDIYSIGVILYEGLSRRLPFEAETVGDLIVQIVTSEPPPLRALDPKISQPLSDLVAQAMAKNREQRFADARAMRSALLAAVERSQAQQARAGAGSPPPAPLPRAAAAGGRPGVPQGRSPGAAEGAATAGAWGDFEGLNATHLVDRSAPVPSKPAPAVPQKQRVMAHVSGAAPASPPPSAARAPSPPGAVAQTVPDLDLELAVEPQQSRAAASAGRGGRAARARGRKGAGTPAAPDDALNPLYAGADQAVPDIDYVRARVSPAAGGRRAIGIATQDRDRASRVGAAPRPKLRYRRKWGHWVLPLIAIALGAYIYMKPGLGSAPRANGVARERSSVMARAASDAELGKLRLVHKARRRSPGSAPPHMRDVVF